ncbi:MAG: hypothetical protein K2J80_05430 [Oscillospiraceae bacterium]|nr:hypothetical protein [Oscillospiraceae bacterium]
MSGFKINFELKTDLNEIAPFGEKGRYSLSWFGLTDGLLWITAGDKTVYEYSDAALKEWGGDTRYNDYYLSRFLEDFSDIFGKISQPVSKELYDSVEDFEELSQNLLDDIPDDDPEFDRLYDEYLAKREWFADRIFDSGHLKGGPIIGCFRCDDKLKFYWNGDVPLENGESIWTSPRGSFEMPYCVFVTEVKRFLAEFYAKMDEQIKRALKKDWGEIKVDKEYLVLENAERKIGFDQKLALL